MILTHIVKVMTLNDYWTFSRQRWERTKESEIGRKREEWWGKRRRESEGDGVGRNWERCEWKVRKEKRGTCDCRQRRRRCYFIFHHFLIACMSRTACPIFIFFSSITQAMPPFRICYVWFKIFYILVVLYSQKMNFGGSG